MIDFEKTRERLIREELPETIKIIVLDYPGLVTPAQACAYCLASLRIIESRRSEFQLDRLLTYSSIRVEFERTTLRVLRRHLRS